jgi:hypothetical protein
MCKEWYWPTESASCKLTVGASRTTKYLKFRQSYGQNSKLGPFEYEAGLLVRWIAASEGNLRQFYFKAPEFINEAGFLHQPDSNRIYAAVTSHRRWSITRDSIIAQFKWRVIEVMDYAQCLPSLSQTFCHYGGIVCSFFRVRYFIFNLLLLDLLSVDWSTDWNLMRFLPLFMDR